MIDDMLVLTRIRYKLTLAEIRNQQSSCFLVHMNMMKLLHLLVRALSFLFYTKSFLLC